MIWGKQGYAHCITYHSMSPYGSQLLWVSTSLKVGINSCLLSKEVQCLMQDHASQVCNIMGGFIGGLGCVFGCGVLVV